MKSYQDAVDHDYLLIGVDHAKKYAIRFLWLKNGVHRSIELQNPPAALCKTYLEFLLGSVLLGSRTKNQQTILYKLHLLPARAWINCEVTPLGHFRSALFPKDHLDAFDPAFKGTLQVSVLNQNNQIYTSTLEIQRSDVASTLGEYLDQSVQIRSLLQIHADPVRQNKNYGLWIEKLPGTSEEDWQDLEDKFSSGLLFEESFQNTDDPDQILGRLFPENVQILAVTKPTFSCACNLEAFQKALASLPHKDLLELSMEGDIKSQCDYCGKIWKAEDQFLMDLLQSTTKTQ